MSARPDETVSRTDTGAPPVKAWPPPPEHVVPRSQIDTFLDGVPSTPVTVVVGPAGCGKTTSVAAYSARASAAGVTVVWIQDDPARLRDLATEARGGVPPVVLVVDDAHLLSSGTTDLLRRLMVEDDPGLRIVLVSRRPLAWVPHGAVLSGRVRVFPAAGLRLTPAEAEELTRAYLPAASEDDIGAVGEEGEGWAAALVMGARAVAASDDPDVRSVLVGARPPVLDYLSQEVFDHLPGDLARVLLTTCQQEDVTPEEAVLLSDIPRAPALLAEAASTGLMVSGMPHAGDQPPRWHYHPLLREVLRRRTSPTGPDWPLVVEAHHRATIAYAEQRDGVKALHHAALSGDLELQIRTLRDFGAELVSNRNAEAVEATLARLPAELRTTHLDLLVLNATLLRVQHRVDAANVSADRALAAHEPTVSANTEAGLALLELWQARHGWRDGTHALHRAARILGCNHEDPAGAHTLAGLSPPVAHWLMLELAAFETWLGALDSAAIHTQLAAAYSAQVETPVLERAVLTHRAMVEVAAGSYHAARVSADGALAVDSEPPRRDAASARAHLARGLAEMHALELADAQKSLAEFDATPRGLLDPLLVVYGQLLRSSVLLAEGRHADALQLLDRHGDVPRLLMPRVRRDYELMRLFVHLHLGDLAAVHRSAKDMQAAGLDGPAVLASALELGLSGEESRAVRRLEALGGAPGEEHPFFVLTATAVRIALLHRTGTTVNVAAAHAQIPDLLARVQPVRLLSALTVGALVNPGFVELLAAHAGDPEGHPYATTAFTAVMGLPRPRTSLSERRPGGGDPVVGHDRRSGLTRRELEVLRHLALGGTNGDLAAALYVSENTVKTHLASIYHKLEVERRADALRAARARGII